MTGDTTMRNTASRTFAALATGVVVTGASYLTGNLTTAHAGPLAQSSTLPDVGMFATPNTILAASVPWRTTNIQANEHIWATGTRGYLRRPPGTHG